MLKPEEKVAQDLENLTELEILEISKINDYIVPLEIAAKIRGVSRESIYSAIKKGVLVRVEGVTLESLRGYKVNRRNRTNGRISVLYKKGILKKKEEMEEIEEEKGDS